MIPNAYQRLNYYKGHQCTTLSHSRSDARLQHTILIQLRRPPNSSKPPHGERMEVLSSLPERHDAIL